MLLDIFKQDAFSLTSLTQAMLKLPYKPSRLGEMGLFQTKGIPTTTAIIEEKDGVLALLPTQPRGTQATAARRTMRKARSFIIPHIPYDDAVLASDVQGVRAFGSENELETVAGLVNDRLQEMRQSHEVTLEWHRMGAIKGIILDADGQSVIYNLFNEFQLQNAQLPGGYPGTTNMEFGEGQAALTVLANGQHNYLFTLSDPTTNIRALCVSIQRDVEKTLGMASYDHLHCFLGAQMWDAFIDHDDIRSTYLNWMDAVNLRKDLRTGFEYAGITFENYRGQVSGQQFIQPNQGVVFPVGVPNLFTTLNAPADFIETVNTMGLPLYAKQEPLPFNRGIQLHTQQNPLALCTRPLTLIQLTMG